MKKFARFLGFLGFFATLATAQIGSVWAEGFCWMDNYYGLGRTEEDCNKCAEDFPSYPYSMGNYNFSGDLCYGACSGTCTDMNSSFQNGGTYGIPSNSTTFIYRFGDETHNSLVKVNGLTCSNIGNYCAEVFDCGKDTTCSANWKTVNFVDHNNTSLGTFYIGFGTVWSTQKTTECADCLNNPNSPRNYAVFYPVFQTPTAPTREGYTFLGYSDSQTGGSIRIGPYHNNMYGKLNYNNATNISGISGNTITLYARYENAGCAQNYWYNSQTDECIPCAEGFTSPGGYGNQHTCTKSCSETCTQRHNSTDECAEGVTGFYSPIVPIYGTEYEDNQGHCYDNNNIEILAPDNDLTEAHWCQWNCDGCKDEQCYTFVGGACEPKVWNAMYDCDDGANVITDTNHPESYGNYIIADFSCQGQNGQTFIGWTLGSGGIVYNHNDPEHDELTWGCGHQTFKPVFEDNCYEVSFDDETNGGHPSGYPASTPGTHTSFYKKYNNTAWYSDSKCSDKIEIGSGANQVNVIGHLPWKAHATFTGYYYETPTPNRQIFNASGNLTTGNNSGSDWTINGNTVLYAQYTCVDGYAPNANGDCVGDKIDVKYTCVSPVDGEPDTHTFNDDATYGAAYLVKSVGTGNHNVPCAFTGYELDNDYVWNLQDYSGNSTNPNGEYGPNETLSSADWQYITTTPLTEIEFILDKSMWHLKTYRVEYRCGDIKPGADVYTDSSATYGQTYNVAGQFDPFNGGNVTVQDFLDNNCKPNGGFGAWTFQNWTFTCAGANSGPYNTNDPTFGTWTYDSNNCYFTANWGQTDFVIILDQNGGTDGNPSDYLYTRKSIGVYLDSARTLKMLPDHEPNANPLTPPQKTINITIYPDSTHDGTGASFTYNGTIYGYNGANNYANIDENLDFMGYYQNITLNPEKYIDPYDGKGYITSDGIAAGKTYDENNTNDQRTWVAHWGTGTITLPSTATWAGHDFAGWTCVDDENTVVYSCGTNQSCQVTVSENITCTAQWSVACRSVSFDDTTNGEQNSPTNGGNNGRFSKVSGVTGWYGGTECGGDQITPSVVGRIPTKTNAHFVGYNTAVDGTGNEIFNVNGSVTDYGHDTWAPVDNVTLYAQYECDDLYHLNPQTGNCEMCDAGQFYDPGTNSCKTCADILGPNWTSKEGYTWSIDQCYRNCGTDTNDDITECAAITTPSGHGFEQFVTTNGGTGRQISFYGNERQNIYTCRSATGATKCPLGLLASSNPSIGPQKPMAAAVRFNNTAQDENESRYIIGNRAGGTSLSLADGFAWSQVVGVGQQGPEITTELGTYRYTFITYPAETAPVAMSREHQTFAGYGYPETDATELVSARNLTADNANGIIQFAKNLNPAQNNMSPDTRSQYSRNLWPIYTDDPTYTLTYSCGDGGGTPSISPNPVTGIYAGARIVPAQPEGCTNYGNLQFRWWAVSNSTDTHLAGDAGEFEWAYTENKTFTAIWGAANTYNITYLKMPTTNNSITPAGNTLEMPSNQSTSMPDSYTCNASPDTSISGVPRLKNANNEYIGEVVMWCTDSNLETCDLPLELSNAAPCADKNVYAKWECTDQRYHLNENKDDCVVCPNGDYWDPNANACVPCSQLGGGWTSIAGYNWGADQCYRVCNGDNGTSDVECRSANLSYGDFSVADIVENNHNQIEFYGNWRNRATNPELDVCGENAADVAYCPKLLTGSGAMAFKPMSSQVTFMKKDSPTTAAGTRHIVGIRNAAYVSSSYYLSNSSGKIWSHIMGPGQYTGTGNEPNYTFIIYPTDAAPEPSANASADPLFKGYYDTPSGGTRYVEYLLGLDSTNATDIMSGMTPANQITNRTLYPQYCDNGTTWNGSTCTSQTWDSVKYVCGDHGTSTSGYSMENTATYGQSYKVAYSGAQKIAECNPNTGYVLALENGQPKWELNNTGTHYVGYTGGVILSWTYTTFDSSDPTFTALYECDTANGYIPQGTECVLGSGLCQAQLPTNPNPHAQITSVTFENDLCEYTIVCALCVDNEPGCYNHNGAQTFTMTGPTSGTLSGTFCTATEYDITYDDTARTLHFNVDTTNCTPDNYQYGTTATIECTLSAQAGSHAVFRGWCTGADASNTTCDSSQTISSTDYGNKTYYAWWGCDTNYHQNGAVCEEDGNLPLVYRPNGGQPNTNEPVSLTFDQSFTTKGAIYTKTGNRLARWDVADGGTNTFTRYYDATTNTYYAYLEEYYEHYRDTTATLDAHWEQCQCSSGTGVLSCDATVVTNNECTPDVKCKTGYTNPQFHCTGTYNTECTATCTAENQYEIILSKNFTVGQNGPHGEYSNQLYTIHDTGVYRDYEREDEMTETTNPLTSLPNKYYTVTFNHCDRDNDTYCSNPVTTSEIENAYFTLLGFYANYDSEDPGYRYIKQTNNQWFITNQGIAAGKNYDGVPADYTWYAQWNGNSGTLMWNDFPSDPTREGYIFDGWWTQPGETGTRIETDYIAYNDTTLYAHWTVNSCDDGYILVSNSCVTPQDCKPICSVNCTYPGQSNGVPSNSAACPNGTNYSNLVVSCNYDTTSNSQGGYYEPTESITKCRKTENCDLITASTCRYTPNCTTGYIWNNDANDCIPDSNQTYTIKFICEEGGNPIVDSQTVHYGENITVPSNSACTNNPGYSYSRWKATTTGNHPTTLNAQSSTYQYPWEQTHGETFIADWNDGNVYHVNLHAYSCDDSTQTGTFGNSGVQELWEKYGVNWYRTNVGGTLSNPITELTTQQLPTRSGWTFVGYNNLAGDARVRNIGGIWSVSPATLIQNDEDWCAIWSQCNPNEYWNNGVCVTCNTATNGDFPLGEANATSIYQCYRQCSICTPVCPQTEGVNYCEFGNNSNMNGNLYYPGTGTCQPNYEQNCPITVLHCLPGYTPNGNNTACVPNNYMITLNSHIDGFNGHASSPEVLYTKYGPNGGAYLDNGYVYLMNDEQSLYAVPEKSADVILNGNGGNVIWNGYSSSTATLTATFDFQGFYPSVYGGSQYIFDTGYISTNGNIAAQQNQSNSTVWHAQWQDGSITLPDAQRQCYTFNGWWTDMYNGVSAGNANMPYTPTGATTNLYAHWTPGTYSITYHNGNAIYSGCSTTSYTFGNAFAINCSITPQAGSHKVFNGWCTNPELTAGCTQNPVISNTDCGDKDYYAWWGCESGYNLENGVCVPNASELCPARTLPNNAHATFVSGALNSNGTECIYTLKCEACTGCNNNNYTCYTHDNSATNGGIFTVNGSIGDASVLNNVSCNATEYDVYYRCDSSTAPGTLSGTQATYGEPYYVESNGTTITCQSNDQLFNGWTFNGNNQVYYPGTSNYMINSWNYCNITPIFTASYGQCEAGQIYVPSLGKCRPSCPVPCTWAGYPANPAQCPTPQYPAGATCWYLEGNPAAQTGYVPEYDPNACLNPMTDATITPQTCNVDPTQDPICPEYQHWENNTCEWNTYYVTLDSNNGIEGSNFVSKLFEKYTIGWSRTDNRFTSSLNLDPDELPSPSETCKVFKGYFNRRSGGQQMIQADGYVSSDGYQPLPSTTITDNNQKWYAQYIDNPGTFTIKFRCSANGGDIYTYTVHMGDANLTAPAATVCSGVAFNQWKGSTHPEILLDAGSYFAWNHCFDEVFVPDTKAVYHVDLNENGGMFPSNEYQELWYAVDLGWYKNAGLTTQITSIPGDSLPTKQGSNFNGWLDSTTQAQRGNFSGANWALPASISANETWDAQWGPCAAGQYWDNGVCKSCSDATGGAYPLADANATNVNQCYKICSICLTNGCPTVHGANCVYNPNDPSVQNNGKEYNNGTQTCVSNTNPTPNCPYMITDCDLGWVPAQDGQSCVEDEKHTITLESHIIHGVSSDPEVLYTWHNRGVYLYSNYTGEMRANQNPLSENPLNYAIVTFNLNGQGASLIWNGQTYMGSMDANVLFDYQGFWKSVNGSPRYIDVDGYINGSGIAAGTGYTDDATWHARWQSRTLGTISSSGNDLPVPTRPGFVFDGWYDLPMGGNQVDSSSLVNNDMTVYAHWSDVIYEVKLVSDRNNCQPSNNTPTKLYEKYNVGWNRAATGTFDPNLTLTDDELPTPNAGYEFKGYYDALSGGDRVIRPDGRVEQEPNYTDNNHTWYARCGRPTGPFTITFRCGAGEDPLPNYTQSVQNGGTVRVPPTSACSNAGYTFTSWMGNHNTTFTARDTEYTATWSDVYANEDFTPDWNNGNVYYVTLAQTDATEPGIEILYEKYDNGWGYTANGPFNVTRLSGSQLPRRSGYVFAGYKYNDVQMGYVSNGQWRLPDPTVLTDNNQVWEPDWSQCEQGEYWDGNKCYPCPDGFTDNPHAIGAEQCYGNCEYDCQDSGCPSPLPVGMQSCAPNHSDYPQWGIKYNRPGATCLPQGQQSLPICPNDIICNNGYDLVGTECRDNRYTIALNSNLYNDNGTLANPSTLYTWFNHGVYRDYNRTYMMTPNDYPLESGTPSTYATVTLNGNGAMFNWHDMYGGQLSDNVDFVFDGFYDTTGAEIDPVIGINRYITGAGQSIGTTAQNNQTWQARWLNGSVDLPGEDIMSRDGYTFAGWWNACDGGALVSMGNQTIAVSGDRTLCAHWSGKSYTVTYNCNSEDGQGGSATDNQLAYQNTSYTVRENFIPCSKPATETTRAHEFENWKFNLNSNTYWPGDSILWIFTDDNPTLNAHYKECSDGSYFDGSCKTCPTGYDHSNINATSPQHCYKTCNVEIPCTQPVSDCPNEEGVLTCVYPQLTSSVSGAQYYGSNECVHDVPSTQYCEPFTIMCKPGYTPDYYLSTDVGVQCTKLADHEITLDANCGGDVTPGQEKLYTTENTGVYLNPARTNQYLMTISDHPLSVDKLPNCVVTATFNHCDNDDPNCYGATITDRGVNLTFNGYYKTASGVTQYTDARSVGGQLKSYITQDGMDDGKGYTTDATWYAHWNASQVGTDKWPIDPTRDACGVTYNFVGWWTDATGGQQVQPGTPINNDVTWYAHWCEGCPANGIANGSCTVNSCVATINCNNDYTWDTNSCSCVLSPDPRFTLTYKPNGGTPTQPRTQSLRLNETFTTLGGDTFSKSGEVLCRWVSNATTYTFPDGVAELSTEYTYLNENDTTLLADWVACQCTSGTGVQGCSVSVVNNACVPTVTCMPGYVPNELPTCTGECNTNCNASCRQCEPGTYQDGNECKSCDNGFTSGVAATSCYGETITVDWDENGGNPIDQNGSCQFCVDGNGCTSPACESCGTHPANNLTLAAAPTHNNNAMQFLGWKLATGNDLYSAGTNVMCTYNNVGVYSGISTHKIKAQWNQCQCINPLNPHVAGCTPIVTNDTCAYINWCDTGYELDQPTAYTPAAVCNPITSNITYDCGDGTGMPVTATDTAEYDADYTVKNEGGANCQKTGFNFAGWRFNGDGQLHQAGDRITWNYTSDQTFTAEYTNIQCASDEILIGNDCVKCNCTIGTGATNTSCGSLSTISNTCEWTHPVACLTGFVNPAWNCTGTGNTSCIASCGICPANQVEVSGDCTDCRCTPDTTTGAVSCGTMSISDNMCNWGPATCGLGYGYPNIICEGSSNQSCTVKCQVCPAGTYGPNGLECESCPEGYTSPAGSTSIEDCYGNGNPYTITYQAAGGVNTATGVTDQPVIQNVTYNSGFVTKQGTIFSKTNSIITVWDTVSGGAYPELNHWYQYNTAGDTWLDAHWESCECTTGTGAESCGTLSTAGNTCNWTNPVCQDGYVSPNMQCTGTGNTNCTLTCGECQEGEVIVNGECIPCTCTTGNGAASCTPGATANNTCTAVGQCLVGYGNEDGNANVVCNDTNCVVSYNECGDGWVSNENCQCEICPANTYQSGNTCVPCQNGYTSPAGSSSADACVPGAHTIHYLSNNGTNETYNQGVYYGQSFTTEGGTRFTYTNHIMTHWNVESGSSSTFTNGTATLSGNYVYNDATDTTLSAQWAQCTCDADGCTTYATNSNECACNASEESCPDGYIYGGCECNGTNCAPICTLSQSNAIYNCGTGTGIPPVSELVGYGTPYTIKANATVYGCSRENSTFAGWEFDGDQQIHAAGDTVTWNYTTDKNFRAVYCNNCLPEDHCTLDIPNPGECVVTCHTGYEWNSTLQKCVAKTYPNENGITYKPNGGTPNQNYTQSVTYDAPFTTLDWSAEHYRKPRHIMTQWAVESGGVGTFDSGYANLGTEYTYKTDGATVLAADWTECAADKISLNNQCQQCNCTAGTGTTSCGTLSTDDDTCAWGPVSCQTGYVNPTLDCSDDTTSCTASCTQCGNKQVEVNGTCTDCECEINGDGVNSGCGFVSNNGNICNWNPTTCKLGYGYPELTCTDSNFNNDCTASCTICPAGQYGDDGLTCKDCPDGKTSLPGATSKKECFIDPNSCAQDEHIEHGECVSNTRACSIPNATSAARIWNPAIGTYGPCTVIECDEANGYHESGNACVRDTCTVAHGSAESEQVGPSSWECFVTKCDPGYEPSSDYKSCVECANRYVDGDPNKDVAVSSYVSECEIAACMYQGQKYALQNGECVSICETETDETGTKVWDERTNKCVRTCKPGYKMW